MADPNLVQNDDQRVKEFGVRLAMSMVEEILGDPSLGVSGVHLCTLNLEKSARFVSDGLGLSHESHRRKNHIIEVRVRSPPPDMRT